MKYYVLSLGLMLSAAASAYGQGKFSWQDHCFNNPGSPVCKGHDFAVKPAPAAAPSRGVTRNAFPSTQSGGRSAVSYGVPYNAANAGVVDAIASAMNWSFADPSADAIAGINVRALSGSALARNLIVHLAAQQGLGQQDVERLFEKLADVDQIAISIHGKQVVAFVIGQTPDSIPQGDPVMFPDTGLKAARISRYAMLVGDPEAVDQSLHRIASDASLPELTAVAESKRATGAEFWAIGSPAIVVPEAAGAGAVWSSITAWTRDLLTVEFAFDFSAPPSAATLRNAQARLGPIWVQGNTILSRTQLNETELAVRFPAIAEGPIGRQLSALVGAARYVPGIDPAAKKRKPTIVGLDDQSK